MTIVSFEYGALVIEVGLVLTYSAVVFLSTYFLFRQVQTQAIGMSMVKAHLHCKKRITTFLSPAGMSLTKLSLAGKN